MKSKVVRFFKNELTWGETIVFILTVILMTVVLIVMIATFSRDATATEVSFQTSERSHNAPAQLELSSWREFNFKLHNDNTFYFASYETAAMYMGEGAKGNIGKLSMYGLGGGLNFKPVKTINIYTSAGIYYPQLSKSGFVLYEDCEGCYYALNSIWAESHGGYIFFDEGFELEAGKHTFGGTIGINMERSLWKNATISLGAEYRIMSLKLLVAGMNSDFNYRETGARIEDEREHGINSIAYTVSLKWAF